MKPGATQLTVIPRLATSLRKRLRHADQAGLRGGVVRLPGIAGDADHRGDADDAAEALPHHALQRRARQAEGRLEVDAHDHLPVLVLHAHGEPVARQPGIVDEDVEPAHQPLRFRNQRFDRGGVGEVGRRRHGRRPAEPLGKGFERLDPRARQRHGRALRVQGLGDRAADAAARAGDQRALSRQAEHSAPPMSLSSAATALTSSGVPTAIASTPGAMRLARPVSTLPAPISTKPGHAVRGKPGDRFPPAHRAGHLLHEALPDLGRIGDRRRQDIGDKRHGGRVDRRAGERVRHHFRRRLPSARNGTAPTRRAAWRAGRPGPWRSRSPARRRLCVRRRRPARARCRSRPRRPRRPSPLRSQRPGGIEVEPEQRRHGADCPPAPPSAWRRRAGAAAARRRRSKGCRRRRARNIRQANGRPRRPHGCRRKSPRASRARSAAMLTAISAGWALRVRVSSSSGPSKMSAESFSPSASSTSSNTARAAATALGERLSHADGLASLAGKDESRAHAAPLLLSDRCTLPAAMCQAARPAHLPAFRPTVETRPRNL